MTNIVKSGQEIIDEFLADIKKIEGVDQDVACIVVDLFHKGKLSNINLSNEFERIRKEKLNDKN